MVAINNLKELPVVQAFFGPSVQEKLEVIEILSPIAMEHVADEYPYHFIVYLNLDKRLPVLFISGNLETVESVVDIPSFKDTLLEFSLINFESILFLSTFYGRRDSVTLINASKIFTPIPSLDEWLKNSFGYIAYAHQFEQLYCMITGSTPKEAVDYRKYWNKKFPAARFAAKGLQVTQELMLDQLLNKRTIEENQFVFNANFNGAYQLWNYIVNNQK